MTCVQNPNLTSNLLLADVGKYVGFVHRTASVVFGRRILLLLRSTVGKSIPLVPLIN